jgi:hypothetical protein
MYCYIVLRRNDYRTRPVCVLFSPEGTKNWVWWSFRCEIRIWSDNVTGARSIKISRCDRASGTFGWFFSQLPWKTMTTRKDLGSSLVHKKNWYFSVLRQFPRLTHVWCVQVSELYENEIRNFQFQFQFKVLAFGMEVKESFIRYNNEHNE